MASPASPLSLSFPVISGYTLLEQLYLGTRTAVYRGLHVEQQRSVVIKVLRREYPSFSELVQFRNQYAITKSLAVAGIVHPLSLEPLGNSYALVMEDMAGISLGQYAQQPLELLEILAIALQLAEILHELHQHRVIHKDIKPANILIQPESKRVKLIDFSLASLLPKETQEIQNPNVLEGTLAYLAPEQTGRMNRGIDYRADFYSLGVTLYELLTGALPFTADDPLELIHCHIAKAPIPANQINPSVPKMVADIVSTLMTKNAEDRYQSAIGLKHDLEQCLVQWKQTGTITPFLLRQRDLSDRFLIPEKLYGRETEVQDLLDAFERVSQGETELMLVTGFSGIGKTAVINEVHKPIVRQRGYFIKGKYDQFQRNIPFSAFVQVFRDLIGQLLSENDAQLTAWKDKILAAVSENGQVIVDVIPELERIIGQQPPVPELTGNAAQNRFNLLFQRFIQVFTTADHPLVIFLDDLQWADSASLNLLKLLMSEASSGYLLILGAYRDNEVSSAHPLMLTLEQIEKTRSTVHTITLNPLTESTVNQLVAETLNCTDELAQPLTQWVYQKTQGNPFFTTQFLKSIHEEGWIQFQPDLGYWQCDLASVRQFASTNDVVEFMAAQLQKLPDKTQEVLQLAACIGNRFELKTLAIVSEESSIETANHLWQALQEGLIVPVTEAYKFFQSNASDDPTYSKGEPTVQRSIESTIAYRFLHDRVQQAAYSLIDENQKQAVHLKIGQLLQQNLSEVEKEERLFDIVEHLNLAQALITQPNDRESLAQLNLTACERARNSTAYASARDFVQSGLELLSQDCWQHQYELTLKLYVTAAEIAYLNADLERMKVLVAEVLQSARTILDKVKVYEIQISALVTQSQVLDALTIGRTALAQFGITLPAQPDQALTEQALQALNARLQDKQIEQLIDLSEMSNPETVAVMRLLALLFAPIFLGNPGLLPLLCSTMVSLSLEFGNAPASSIGYVSYGMVLSTFLGEVEQGYRFGRVAIEVLNQLNAQEFKSVTLLLFGSFLQHRQEALKSMLQTTKEGYLSGMETGDFLNAGYSLNNYFYCYFFSGISLDEWEPEVETYGAVLAKVKQDSALTYLKMQHQAMYNLRESTAQPELLIGDAYDETVMLSKHHQDHELTALAHAYIFKLILSFLFERYTPALDYITQANLYLMGVSGMVQIPAFHFYSGLTYLAQASEQPELEQNQILALVEAHQSMLAQWAAQTPKNHQHRVDLVEAEKCRVLGQKLEAIDRYDKAIAGARENGYLQEEALASELAAKFYLAWGKERFAVGYMQDAYYCYMRWGAKAKVAHLKQQYPHLLAAILQPMHPAIVTGEMISRSRLHNVMQTSSSNSQNLLLDFPAVMKATQAISQEIELEKLIATLMQITIANAGAQTGVLVIRQASEWFVVARAHPSQTEHLQVPLIHYQDVPQKLIYSVARSQKTEVFDDLNAAQQFASDRYITIHQPKSALCTPIIQQGKLIGVLYLENNLTLGAFTRDRIETLQVLIAQVGISIENARLYQQIENYSQTLEAEVAAKTEDLNQKALDLEQALKNLQQTQVQLIQSEKMSALGQLVAGIAHEINNPATFIHGNLKYLEGYLKDLLDLLELYEQEYPEKSSSIQARMEEIDLNFICEDSIKVLQSMEAGSQRIRQIILRLRNFSRLDESEMKSVDLHSGIDSTLLILQSRLQASENQPHIEIMKEYGDLPWITCYASEMNQVFLSIISNAIDALKSEERIENPLIRIQTEVLEAHQVRITIADNGSGIPVSIQERVFDPFFTTKPVGSGVGLGLSVSYAIVKRHGGQLTFDSTVGRGTKFMIEIPIEPSINR